MKRLYTTLLLLMLFLSVSLCACGAPAPTPSEHIHAYADWMPTKTPTCTEEGEQKRYCACGESQVEAIPTVAHTYAGGVCTACGTEEAKQQEHEHTYGTWSITMQPTCQQTGEQARSCTCGDVQKETLPKIAHVYENGTCMGCGDEEPVHTHSYSLWIVTKQPTCKEVGEKTRSCSCGDVQSVLLDKVAHQFNGNSCTVCGHTHSYGAWQTVDAATCEKQGTAKRVCECGDEQTKSIALKEHTYADGKCTVCGKEEAHTHVFIRDEVTREATCKSRGELTSYCGCGYSFTQEFGVIEHIYIDGVCKWCGDELKHDHSYSGWTKTKEPTCEKEGEMTRYCGCGDTQAKTISKVDHNYVNGICTMCKRQNTDAFVPDYGAGEANTVGNVYGSTYSARYATQGDWIYFPFSDTELIKLKKSTNTVHAVYQVPSGTLLCMNAVGDWLYFYVEEEDVKDCYMAKVRTDGSRFEKLVTGVRIEELLVVRDTIFYTTIKNPYSNYGKDCAPMYMISVTGGTAKQLHDGYVSSMVSDGTYVYFRYAPKTGASSIRRIKCDGTTSSVLYSNADVNYIFLSNGKLYFSKFDEENFESTLASISTKGGSYTAYGKITGYTEWIYVHGDSIYYIGEPYGLAEPRYGLVEYNTVKKTYTFIKEDFEYWFCYTAPGIILTEMRSDDFALTGISVYYLQQKRWLSIDFS